MESLPEEFTVPGFVGPLIWGAARRDVPPQAREELTLDSLVRFVSRPLNPRGLESFAEAYNVITEAESPNGNLLFIAPFEPHLLDKLIWPMRNAKAAYVLGNPLTTIALCGTVAEMLTIFFLELHLQDVDDQESMRRQLDEFEEMRQVDRIKQLVRKKAISPDDAQRLRKIKDTRKQYLHIFSRQHDAIELDAVNIYGLTFAVLAPAIVKGYRDGSVVLNPPLARYLKRHNLINATVEAVGEPRPIK